MHIGIVSFNIGKLDSFLWCVLYSFQGMEIHASLHNLLGFSSEPVCFSLSHSLANL